jgi:hypothetical protein
MLRISAPGIGDLAIQNPFSRSPKPITLAISSKSGITNATKIFINGIHAYTGTATWSAISGDRSALIGRYEYASGQGTSLSGQNINFVLINKTMYLFYLLIIY